jgi:hemerythrin
MTDDHGENWFDGLRLGVAEIDDQHRYLVGLILEFESGKNNADPRKILMELMRYTRAHFTEEEAMMGLYGYPGKNRHRDLHDELLKDVVRFSSGDLSDPALQHELHHLLRAWLIRHILQEDADFAQFLKNR